MLAEVHDLILRGLVLCILMKQLIDSLPSLRSAPSLLEEAGEGQRVLDVDLPSSLNGYALP